MANLAGKTFEVQTSNGVRWTAMDVHESRSTAISQAEELLESNKYFAVQVIADSERLGTEIVFEMECEGWQESDKITVSPIEEAHHCTDIEDFYSFPSRRTIGRLMRGYLDHHGLTALELLFNATHLTLLERGDGLLSQAVQRVAGLQAKEAGMKPGDRAEELFSAVSEIREHALETAAADEGADLIREKGIAAAVSHADTTVKKSGRNKLVRFALARVLAEAPDWNAKVQCLTELCAEGLHDVPKSHLDETLAEILDGAEAVKDLLGGQPDTGTAMRTLARLAVGRCPQQKAAAPAIELLNTVLGESHLPLAKASLFDRVAATVGSTQRLTREGKDEDRQAFVTLVRDLVELAGLEGGPVVAEAMTRRARIVLGTDEDLSFADGLARLLDLLPHRAVRLGFLLDLVVSPTGEKNQTVIFAQLGRVVGQLSSITSFLPSGSSAELLDETLNSLKRRLTAEGLPESWREGIGEALDSVAQREAPSAEAQEFKPYPLDEETKRILAMTPDTDAFPNGEILFEEGDVGDRAYLIKSGEVEIYHKIGNEERVLARLGQGEIFGEMSLIDNHPRMANARVTKDAEFAVITRENIESRLGRLQKSDMVLRRLIDVFVTRIRGEARLHE